MLPSFHSLQRRFSFPLQHRVSPPTNSCGTLHQAGATMALTKKWLEDELSRILDWDPTMVHSLASTVADPNSLRTEIYEMIEVHQPQHV